MQDKEEPTREVWPEDIIGDILSANNWAKSETSCYLRGLLMGVLFRELWSVACDCSSVCRADICFFCADNALNNHSEDIFRWRRIPARDTASSVFIDLYCDPAGYRLAADAAKDQMLSILSGDCQQ